VRAAWRLLTGQRDLRLVLSAGLISGAGDWILLVGMLYRVYTITGSAVASALTMASAAAPQVLLGAVAGVFADRWDRKRMMITANLLQAAGLVPLLLVHSAGRVWIVFLVMFTEGVIAQFFGPAQQAMVPRLVPEEQLLTANALSGQVGDMARLAGSGLGGVIAAVGGITAVTLTDAASFIGSAALIALVRTSGSTAGTAGSRRRMPREPKGRGAAWTEERRRSDEGRRCLVAVRRRAGETLPRCSPRSSSMYCTAAARSSGWLSPPRRSAGSSAAWRRPP